MRRKLTFLITLWWIILCGVIGVCMLLFAGKTPVVSEEENRTLAGMPALTLTALKNGDISGKFYVQVGAFSSKANADGLVARLQGRGSGARSAHAPDVGFWRVQVGPYPSLKHAEEAATSMSGEFPNNFVVAD